MFGLAPRLTPLSAGQIGGVLNLCRRDPLHCVPLAQQLQRWRSWGRGDVVAVGSAAEPRAAAWSTGSLIVAGVAARREWGMDGVSPRDAAALARHAAERLSPQGSIMGPAADVRQLWPLLQRHGVRARELRMNQPLMCAPVGARMHVDPRAAACLQRPQESQAEEYVEASVAMFIEELGYDPRLVGDSYRQHILWLMRQGRCFALCAGDLLIHGWPAPALSDLDPSTVVFKTDVGGLWTSDPHGTAAQLTGIWVHPAVRRTGVARAGLDAVTSVVWRELCHEHGWVSLYVNDFNVPARRLYESAGWRTVSAYATVLL